MAAPVPAGAADAAQGSLYPADSEQVSRSALAKALGPAAHLLTESGPSDAFQESVRTAIANHPAYRSGESAVLQREAGVRRERGALMPRISGTVAGDYVIDREFGANADNVVQSLQPASQANVGLSVSQLIFDGGATFARIDAARASAREGEGAAMDAANRLIVNALTAHQDALAYSAIAELGAEYIKRHERLLQDVEERFRLGAGSRADVKQAAARLASARARVIEIQQNASLAEIRYREYFQAPPSALRRPSIDALAVSSREETISAALARHPAAAIATARIAGADAAVRAQRATRMPELRANLAAVKYDVFDSDDYDLRAGVNLNYDFFTGGARGASIAEAREAARQSRLEQERVALELARNAAIAFERQRAGEARVAALSSALVAQHQAREYVYERFRVARGDLIDILQAEQDWFEAGVQYVVASASRDVAIYEVMSFTGDLLRLFSPDQSMAQL